VGRLFAENEDVQWMRRALLEAAKGRGSVEPNPLVGAVVVRDDRLVGVGHHERFGRPHAEINALDEAQDEARGATLYVTLEPCCHFGKTPPCTDAILAAGIARVVVAMNDPFPEVNGRGLAALQARGLKVETGCEAAAARSLNAPYLKRLTTGMPLIVAKWAMTLDGKTAVSSGDSRWISSESSRALVHELRGQMDGILVGISTVDSDDPLLTARPAGPRCPARIVLDSAGRLPTSSQLARTARDVPVIVAVTDKATLSSRDQLAQLGCEVIAFPGSGRVPIGSLLAELGRRGMTNVLVEGGGRVLGSFIDEGHVDALEVFIAPTLEGGDHARSAVRGKGQNFMRDARRLRDVDVSQVGGDVLIRGWLPQAWRAAAGFDHGE
jgi:diaminohydroxyphosphoribosylaminopyrimidine deaminase / 5-amino-6-(5-phosphoribosylamino)uracil reductase